MQVIPKVRYGKTLISQRQAFFEGLSTGLKNLSRKGKRPTVLRIGNKTGFVEGGLLLFESKKKAGNLYEDMNSTVFLSVVV